MSQNREMREMREMKRNLKNNVIREVELCHAICF